MLTIGISSRALFELKDGHRIYVEKGPEAFDAYMFENEKKPLRPGVGFNLVKKLLALNTPGEEAKVRVILLSSNTLNAGARVMNSVRHYGLDIETALFTSGGDRFRLAKAANLSMFLSTNPTEVKKALELGIPSATVLPDSIVSASQDAGLCIAFDGDAVLFGDDAERVNHMEGLAAFQEHEKQNAQIPLSEGPFKAVLQELCRIQSGFLDRPAQERPIRIALVTARGTPASDRVLTTLRSWGLQVDEALFCGGLPKGPFLHALGADLFFDDGMHNIESAVQYVPACHVPHGIVGSRQ